MTMSPLQWAEVLAIVTAIAVYTTAAQWARSRSAAPMS